MVVDTSALLAILFGEPEAKELLARLHNAWPRLISAPTLVEAEIVTVAKLRDPGLARLRVLVSQANLDVVPFNAAHQVIATNAFVQFGKGRHPAGLNFGDCFGYALAKATGLPLLYKGNDFTHTDIGQA